MSPRHFTWVFVFATVAAFAVGTINIMRLRVEADTIGSRIQRIERDIALSKKELETVRRQQVQARICALRIITGYEGQEAEFHDR
jgi:hypothetical protein